MDYVFFQRPALVFGLASLTIMTCLEVPYFVSFFCMVIWAWKWLSDLKMVKPISRNLTTVFSVLFAGFVFIEHRTLLTQESSSSLLVGLTALKVMDYANRRDHLSVILLGFLLLTLKPLYGFDLYWLPIQIACMLSLWWAASQDPKGLPRSVLGKIYAVSIPLALILFIAFPRLVLPWAMGRSGGPATQTGFSTDLNPGGVAELAATSNLVFRVRFQENAQIQVPELYWKGAVLTISDGLAWKSPKGPGRKPEAVKQISPDFVTYELIMEPGNGSVVFTLDPTIELKSKQGGITQLENFLWRANYGISKSERFFGKAGMNVKDAQGPEGSDLQVPKLPPQTAAWIEQTKAKTSTFQEKRAALRNLFSHPDFTYTLTPGTYGKLALDEFLFQKRRGFCEHFAGSYATLSRALGIPARVISGYQGAEYNPVGEFWRVSQRQAHAWVEIWNGQEWERLDPTIWVPKSEFSRVPPKSILFWFDQAAAAYDALNFKWMNFLIDFDQNAQKLALQEWMPKIFLGSILILAAFFLIKLATSSLFSKNEQIKKVRQNQLSLLVQQIKETEEQTQGRSLSHLPPLEILKHIRTRAREAAPFYDQVSDLYDRSFYQEKIVDADLKKELQTLQKKWMEIQLLQK